jgi:F-type H+-transporting ATPase subunit b
MEQTLQDLSAILIRAIPTIIILVILHLFLKAALFGPIQKTLDQRSQLTDGARRSAQESLANAERKTREYEERLREAKAAVYKEQEETRRKWLEDQLTQVARAKADAEARVALAKNEIQAEMSAARATLERSSEMLADQIATALLAGRSR